MSVPIRPGAIASTWMACGARSIAIAIAGEQRLRLAQRVRAARPVGSDSGSPGTAVGIVQAVEGHDQARTVVVKG